MTETTTTTQDRALALAQVRPSASSFGLWHAGLARQSEMPTTPEEYAWALEKARYGSTEEALLVRALRWTLVQGPVPENETMLHIRHGWQVVGLVLVARYLERDPDGRTLGATIRDMLRAGDSPAVVGAYLYGLDQGAGGSPLRVAARSLWSLPQETWAHQNARERVARS
jgi:hypothetical protein